jgi:hypothetical protein
VFGSVANEGAMKDSVENSDDESGTVVVTISIQRPQELYGRRNIRKGGGGVAKIYFGR